MIALRVPPQCLAAILAVLKLRATLAPYKMGLTHDQELFLIRRHL